MAAALPDWVILDRFVFLRDYAASLPDKGYAPLRAEGSNSQGVQFHIALCLADPPATSRLYVQFPTGPPPEHGIGCELVAAHGNLFLFRTVEEVKPRDPYDDRLCCEDYFILRVTSLLQPPLLKRLPECTDRIALGENSDGHGITMQRLFYPQPLGLLGSHKQDLAVAHLGRISRIAGNPMMMEAELAVLRTSVSCDSDAMWEVKRIPILPPQREDVDIFGWQTDTVIPFKNYICWVDYYVGGVLFFDVFEGSPKLSYLQLPISGRPHYSYDFKSYIQMYRSVCVTGDGNVLKFVHVDREDGMFGGPLTPSSGFTITSHVLNITEGGKMAWSDDAYIESHKVWPSICANSSSAPEDILTFPLVSMEKADQLHFLFSEPMDDDIEKVSVVTIDMNTETLVSFHPYIKGGGEDDSLMEKDRLRKSFLPTKFSPPP